MVPDGRMDGQTKLQLYASPFGEHNKSVQNICTRTQQRYLYIILSSEHNSFILHLFSSFNKKFKVF